MSILFRYPQRSPLDNTWVGNETEYGEQPSRNGTDQNYPQCSPQQYRIWGIENIENGLRDNIGQPSDVKVTNPDISSTSSAREKGILQLLTDIEAALTPVVGTNTVVISSEAASGNIAAGAKSIEFIPSAEFSGTIDGIAPPPQLGSVELPQMENATYEQVNFTIVAGTLYCKVIR